ncbi:LamG-like jellyroll fold domain-containing protein [Candidatus Poribacteria bacterium]
MRKSDKSVLQLCIAVFCSLLFSCLSHGNILVQTGFEGDDVGSIPQDPEDAWQASGAGFEVSSDVVKEGGKSLAMVGGGGNQALGVSFDTSSNVITAEFWLYIDGVERSLTVFVQEPNSGLTDWAASGPYLNWIGDGARHYPGAWEDIGEFTSGEWHYIRLVVDLGASSYDIYLGDTVGEAHAGTPIGKDLGFRAAIAPPPGKVVFGTYDLTTPAYVDDLLIYEGNVLPEGIFAVAPEGKLASTWGEVKKR